MSGFKLGVNIPVRDLAKFYSQKTNKPLMVPKNPEPNIYFTPIDDNRDQVLERIKKDLDYQFKLRNFKDKFLN